MLTNTEFGIVVAAKCVIMWSNKGLQIPQNKYLNDIGYRSR